jgi:hypothetical protein
VEPYRSRAEEEFEYPEDQVVNLAVCEDTHTLATKWCPRQSEDIFIVAAVLPETCPLHGGGNSPGRRKRGRF